MPIKIKGDDILNGKELEIIVNESIDREKQKAFELNEYIFSNPETPHTEFLACARYAQMLRAEGIEVEEEFLGIKTAFRAVINEDPDSGFTETGSR